MATPCSAGDRRRRFVVLLALIGVCGVASGMAAAADSPQTGENLALGVKYRLDPQPSYKLCTDPGDATQLTDGRTTHDYFWTQKGTVGWQHARYATVTVDLGRVEPIGGAAMTTAAGTAGVTWPMSVPLLVSDDGKTWYDAGDLVALDHKLHGPWPEGYAIRRLETHDLAAHGRFVRFVVIPLPGAPYIFCDEVQVFRGPESLVDGPRAGAPTDVKTVFEQGRVERSVRLRFESDARAIRDEIDKAASLDDAARQRLQGELAEIEKRLVSAPVETGPSFRAVLPIGPEHARLFGVQAELWKARGLPPLSAWAANPWDPLELVATLPADGPRTLRIAAMRNERRAAAVNVANSTDSETTLRVRLIGPAEERLKKALSVCEVQWTDTSRGQPVAAALPAARRERDAWTISVLPGMVRQVWLSLDAKGLPEGEYPATLEFECDGRRAATIDLALTVWPVTFPDKPTLLVGGWSYTNGAGSYGITAENRKAFLSHLQSHYVSAPWATAAVMRSYEFSDDDPPKVRLDTRAMDDWIAQWPDARRYMVFLSVAHYSGSLQSSFGGAAIGSEQFNRRVGAWISAWVRHLESKGIGPERLGLLIHDEPHEGSDVGPLLAWARAIRAAEPKVLLWEDPTYRKPAAAPAELFEACDVLCPNRPMWLSAGKSFADFYADQRKRGRELQFYSCSGPARLLDPYSYYRLQAWQCWQAGATGTFFWAFGDNGGASSWNEYLATSGPYTPLFIDDRSVTAGKQMEAIRESVQDYEYFVMLRGAVEKAKAAGRSDAAVARAESLLAGGAAEVLDAQGAAELLWHTAKDRGKADAMRQRIAAAIVSLASKK